MRHSFHSTLLPIATSTEPHASPHNQQHHPAAHSYSYPQRSSIPSHSATLRQHTTPISISPPIPTPVEYSTLNLPASAISHQTISTTPDRSFDVTSTNNPQTVPNTPALPSLSITSSPRNAVCPRWEKTDFRVFDFELAKVVFQLHISYSTRCKKPDVKISMHSGDTAFQICESHKT